MKLRFEVDQAACFRKGIDCPESIVTIEVDPQNLPEDERNLIFRRFWRRDRRKAGSTGLGLSIVQRIAELHSATITVENRRPHGACFSLKIATLT